MYAVVRTGGKQYKVKTGELLRVEKLELDLGSEFDLTEVLLVGGEKVFVGNPTLADAKVTAVVTRQAKFDKIIVFKKKRRQGYRRLNGHRQPFTEIFIKSITTPEGQTHNAEREAPVYNPLAKRSAIEGSEGSDEANQSEGALNATGRGAKGPQKKAPGKKASGASRKAAPSRGAKKKVSAASKKAAVTKGKKASTKKKTTGAKATKKK